VLAAPCNKTLDLASIFPRPLRKLKYEFGTAAAHASTYARGVNDAERRAVRFYRLRGYRILDTNAWSGGNEVDVVARRGRSLIFCEVKSKTGRAFGDPVEMVGPEKQRRLRRAAESWLAARPPLASLDVTFEVIAVRGNRLERIRDAF
jgi:putative endonuclease